jgi:hypothetical protein
MLAVAASLFQGQATRQDGWQTRRRPPVRQDGGPMPGIPDQEPQPGEPSVPGGGRPGGEPGGARPARCCGAADGVTGIRRSRFGFSWFGASRSIRLGGCGWRFGRG